MCSLECFSRQTPRSSSLPFLLPPSRSTGCLLCPPLFPGRLLRLAARRPHGPSRLAAPTRFQRGEEIEGKWTPFSATTCKAHDLPAPVATLCPRARRKESRSPSMAETLDTARRPQRRLAHRGRRRRPTLARLHRLPTVRWPQGCDDDGAAAAQQGSEPRRGDPTSSRRQEEKTTPRRQSPEVRLVSPTHDLDPLLLSHFKIESLHGRAAAASWLSILKCVLNCVSNILCFYRVGSLLWCMFWCSRTRLSMFRCTPSTGCTPSDFY